MKYFFAISPKSLEDALISESKRLMREMYGKKVERIYYRVRTKNRLDNPRRLFIKGDGKVVEVEVKPHISLVHNIELENINDFVKKAKKICGRYDAFSLEFAGAGNYNMNFTFFVGFKSIPSLEKLRFELLELSKPFLSDEEYRQHLDVNYIPHATVLYDDIDPKKVNKAYLLLDVKKFKKPVLVREILLWETTASDLKIVARLPLKNN
jgi:2'-5' RNA ligase